jgi:Ca2+-transporting ATPase
MGKGILFIGLSFFVIMFIMLYHCERVAGVSPKELTIFFTTFLFLQFWNLFNAKTFGSNHSAFRHFWRDNGLILVILIVFAGQWLIVEFGGKMFRTVPLSLNEWLYIISLTSLVLWVGEIWRLIKRKKNA